MIRKLVAVLVFCGIHFCFGQTSLTLPSLIGATGDTSVIPITIGDVSGLGVLSYEITISYDHSVLRMLTIDATGSLSEQTGWTVLSNLGGSSLKIAGFGSASLTGSGTLVNLVCIVLGSAGASTDLSFVSATLNAGNPAAILTNGSFKVPALQLSAPSLLAPLNNAAVDSPSTELEWQAVDGTDRYRVQVASNTSFTPLILDDSSTVGTSIAFGPLIPQGSYYWRVRGTNSGGSSAWSDVWHFESTITGSAASMQNLPGFALNQNYPNPWNPSTVIGYSLPHRSLVTLTVYSTTGEVVARLVNKVEESGYHEVTLHNDHLASGVYLYRLKADAWSLTKAMILLR